VHALVATGVNADGHREILGLDVVSAEDGAGWQRCRTHYARNLATRVPKSAQPWVMTLLRTIFDQPDADQVHAQFDRVVDALLAKFPVAEHLDEMRLAPTCSPSPASPVTCGARCGRTTHRSG
jgi:transposase-like protein